MRYKYCPECGNQLIEKAVGDDGNVPYCETCSKYWFDSFTSCVIVLVYNEFDEVVLARQSYLSDRYASFTSGYVTPGETVEECAIREVKEELGIDIQKLEYAGSYWFALREQLMHGFVAYADKCDLVLSQEIDSAQWVPAKEAPETMFPDGPGNAAYGIYRHFLKMRGLPSVK